MCHSSGQTDSSGTRLSSIIVVTGVTAEESCCCLTVQKKRALPQVHCTKKVSGRRAKTSLFLGIIFFGIITFFGGGGGGGERSFAG